MLPYRTRRSWHDRIIAARRAEAPYFHCIYDMLCRCHIAIVFLAIAIMLMASIYPSHFQFNGDHKAQREQNARKLLGLEQATTNIAWLQAAGDLRKWERLGETHTIKRVERYSSDIDQGNGCWTPFCRLFTSSTTPQPIHYHFQSKSPLEPKPKGIIVYFYGFHRDGQRGAAVPGRIPQSYLDDGYVIYTVYPQHHDEYWRKKKLMTVQRDLFYFLALLKEQIPDEFRKTVYWPYGTSPKDLGRKIILWGMSLGGLNALLAATTSQTINGIPYKGSGLLDGVVAIAPWINANDEKFSVTAGAQNRNYEWTF